MFPVQSVRALPKVMLETIFRCRLFYKLRRWKLKERAGLCAGFFALEYIREDLKAACSIVLS